MKDELRTNNVHSFIPLGGPYYTYMHVTSANFAAHFFYLSRRFFLIT